MRAGRNGTRAGGGSVGFESITPGRDGAAGPGLDEPRAPIGAESCESVLLALLEPEARLRTQAVAEGRPTDAHRVEDRRLDDDVGRRVGDLGSGAAHDPGDRQWSGGIGDEERLGIERTLDVVEGLEPFTVAREADDQACVVDGGSVERVDRLAELQRQVVAHVDDVADGPLAGRDQAHLDVVR